MNDVVCASFRHTTCSRINAMNQRNGAVPSVFELLCILGAMHLNPLLPLLAFTPAYFDI